MQTVTPIPFPEHLPFNPKFIAPGLEESIPAGVPGASTSAINPGPASAAASAIIPPQPGGVAGQSPSHPSLDSRYSPLTLRLTGTPQVLIMRSRRCLMRGTQRPVSARPRCMAVTPLLVEDPSRVDILGLSTVGHPCMPVAWVGERLMPELDIP